MRLIEESAPPRRLPFSALIGADAISLTGNALTQIAVPWFVLTTTGSAARTGLVAFCGLLPLILAAFLGSTVVDRLGRRRMSIVADVASMACVAAIPLLYARHALAFWQLLALVFVRGRSTRRGRPPARPSSRMWPPSRTCRSCGPTPSMRWSRAAPSSSDRRWPASWCPGWARTTCCGWTRRRSPSPPR